MEISFCDFNCNGAHEFTLIWKGMNSDGYYWDIYQDKTLHIARYLLTDRTWSFIEVNEVLLHLALKEQIMEHIKHFESVGPMRFRDHCPKHLKLRE